MATWPSGEYNYAPPEAGYEPMSLPDAVEAADVLTTYDAVNLDILLSQFKDKPKFRALVSAFAAACQDAENMLADIRAMRKLEVATGAQLDQCGDIVTLPRESGQSDGDYRNAIKRKIAYNTAFGSPNAMIQCAKDLTGGSAAFTESNGAFSIVVTAPSDRVVYNQLVQMKPAGVSMVLIEEATTGFGWATEDGHVHPGYGFYEDGWDESHGYTAGKLSEQFTQF